MHDESLERRLREALTTEASRLPMTITPAELERRLALRGRGGGNRRLTLLVAAAVAIGTVSVGGMLSGAIKLGPTATAPVTAVQPSAPTTPVTTAAPGTLPTLDELMAAGAGNGTVLVAQAHDPFETRAELLQQPDGGVSAVGSPTIYAAGTLTVSIVCVGDATLEYDFRTVPGSSPGRTMTCDGTETTDTFDAGGQPGSLVLFFREPLRWRVVLRGAPVALPLPTTDAILPPAEPGMEELVRRDDQTSDSTERWGDTGLVLQETEPVSGRFEYDAHIWCEPGDDLRLILGDHLENAAELTADTETYVRCNGLPMDLNLRMAHPSGSRIFVATAPGARWSLVVTSEQPPVSSIEEAGWQSSVAYGPEYIFEEHGISFSNSGVEGGGPLLVELECAGPEQRIEVAVDLTEPLGDKGKSFFADCAPGGVRTGQLFNDADVFWVQLVAPGGTWVTAAALIPSE